VFLLDLREEMGAQDLEPFLAADGVHLTIEGENEVANRVFRAGEESGWWDHDQRQGR
jgi:hypothetical protein